MSIRVQGRAITRERSGRDRYWGEEGVYLIATLRRGSVAMNRIVVWVMYRFTYTIP